MYYGHNPHLFESRCRSESASRKVVVTYFVLAERVKSSQAAGRALSQTRKSKNVQILPHFRSILEGSSVSRRVERPVPCCCQACRGASTTRTTTKAIVSKKSPKIDFLTVLCLIVNMGPIILAMRNAPELCVCFAVRLKPRRPPCPRYVGEESTPKKLSFEHFFFRSQGNKCGLAYDSFGWDLVWIPRRFDDGSSHSGARNFSSIIKLSV